MGLDYTLYVTTIVNVLKVHIDRSITMLKDHLFRQIVYNLVALKAESNVSILFMIKHHLYKFEGIAHKKHKMKISPLNFRRSKLVGNSSHVIFSLHSYKQLYKI